MLKLCAELGLKVEGEAVSMGRFRARVTPRFLVVRTEGYPMEETGGKVDELTKLGLTTENQIFIRLGKMQRMTLLTGAPFNQFDGLTVRARLDAARKLSVQARCRSDAQAKGILNLLESSLSQSREFIKRVKVDGAMPDLNAYEALFFPTFEREDATLRMSWDGGQLSHAKILAAVLGIENARSTQDGPRK